MGYATYAEVALKLFDNGYEPIPIRAGEKRPAVTRWPDVTVDQAQVQLWGRDFSECGIGLRTGHLIGFDIDVLDQDLAHQMGQIVEQRLGSTLIRVGLWPKRLYLYRTATPFAKLAVRKLEVLGRGQQFVAFGVHPVTRKPYYWPGGESPLDVPFAELPLVNEATFADVLAELASLQPEIGAAQRGRR